ncbi:hypothetical protein DVJ83_05450 [Deinococcus wulumuqiensis]|uniref:Uncharacterized protein n=1 Tax=Deinococcus wulumuqiensis TaxID=980427 RepID=A0A345IG75_9DEIO|nr:hypothetical protein DVJ83_05450 [Deinococcus wulumuqiensis]
MAGPIARAARWGLYGFRLIPAQSGKRRLCIHIAESVSFPTPSSRIESRNLLDSIGIRITNGADSFRRL